mgnify:FL=1
MKRIFILLLLVVCITYSYAIDIKGKIVDKQDQPIGYANVTLLSKNDSSYISGVVTDNDGNFKIEGTNACILKITCIGYADKIIGNISGNLGTIILSDNNYSLHEVVIRGQRPRTRIKNDALVTTIEGSSLSKAGTANDVLGKVPGIVKDNDGIEVIGKGTPLIYINGRLVRNKSELDQLSSSGIRDVEVVTTPGAKYDASVNSVVRIITIKPVGEGLSFDNRSVLGVNHYVHGLDELNLNYRYKGLDIFGMAEYENHRSRTINEILQDTYLSSHHRQSDLMHRYEHNKLYAGKFGINYMLSDKQSIGLVYNIFSTPIHNSSDIATTILKDEELYDSSSGYGTSKGENIQHILSGYYSGTFNKWSLDANIDMLLNHQNDNQSSVETSSLSGNRNVISTDSIHNHLYAGKIVAGHHLFKGDISFGTEISYVNRNDTYDNVENIIKGSATKIKESNAALFAELTQKIGKTSTVLGLRYEHVDSRYYENDIKMEGQSRKYDNLFPSAMLSFPIGNTNVRISYSRKISRPAYSQLSSNIEYINRYTYQSGNSYLKPSYRDYASVVATYKWLTAMVDYSHVKDYIITSYSSYKNDSTIALLTKDNVPGYNSLSAMVAASPSFGIYHPSLMIALEKQFFNVDFCKEQKSLDNPVGIVRFSNDINLPFDSWLNADLSWRSAGDVENMHIKNSWQFDLGIYKAFMHDKLSIKFACTDLFKTACKKLTLYSDIRKIYMNKSLDTRNLELTIRFNFNAAKSKYKGTGAGDSEKGRL